MPSPSLPFPVPISSAWVVSAKFTPSKKKKKKKQCILKHWGGVCGKALSDL